MLPRFMCLHSSTHRREFLTRSIVKSLITEVTDMQPSSETVLSRLMDLLFIHAFAHLVYVTRARMHRATRLLQEKGNSLADIALATGYESDSSFSKAFSRLYGKTPGQYRRDSIG